jgi:SAM-dependent methyltransferase
VTSTPSIPLASTTAAPPAPDEHRIPLRAGSARQFAALREFLAAVGYTEPEICRRHGVPTMYEFKSIADGRVDDGRLNDPVDLLVRLFLDWQPVEHGLLRAQLPPQVIDTLFALGLLEPAADDADRVRPTVLLYPTRSLYLVSDAPASVQPASLAPAVDLVFPAITHNTRTFIGIIPETPCDSFLELCAGTGIAALVAARTATHAWAVDITERSTRFADFNARLNGIENCTALRGDLFEPVRDRTFDRIAAHPPYMPSFEQQFIFRDGGEDGEQITRRILGSLATYLRPGGEFYCTCMGTDRTGARFEQRVRQMLGEREGEFDLVLASHGVYDFGQYYLRSAMDGRMKFSELEARARLFRELKVEHLVYCSMVIRRRVGPGPALTLRRTGTSRTSLADLQWLLRWETAAAQPGAAAWILDSRPRASPAAEVRIAHRVREGEWVPAVSMIVTPAPFVMEAQVPLWTTALLTRSDGRRTARELLAHLIESDVLPPDVPPEGFAGTLRDMIAAGFLVIEGFEHPPAPASTA